MATKTPEMAKAATRGEREIVVERVFNASRDRVWRAFTERDLIAQWWGRGNKMDVEKFEPVTGGHWRFIEHSDGQSYGFAGSFREVTPKDRIVQTFEFDGMPGYVSIDAADFSDVDGGRTKVVSTSLFFTQEERDGMFSMMFGEDGKSGLHESYAALDRLLETL